MNRILALDIGTKRIGVAVSDGLNLTAQPLTSLEVPFEISVLINKIKDICSEYEIKKIVIGLPKKLNGELGEAAEKVHTFARELEKINIEIVFFDERLTTALGERFLIERNMKRKKRKSIIDQVAAMLILQGYLDSKNK